MAESAARHNRRTAQRAFTLPAGKRAAGISAGEAQRGSGIALQRQMGRIWIDPPPASATSEVAHVRHPARIHKCVIRLLLKVIGIGIPQRNGSSLSPRTQIVPNGRMELFRAMVIT